MSTKNRTVTLRLYGALRQVAGGREVEVECGEETVGELLERFAAARARARASCSSTGRGISGAV